LDRPLSLGSVVRFHADLHRNAVSVEIDGELYADLWSDILDLSNWKPYFCLDPRDTKIGIASE
jgi:hypothetical protein